MLDAAADLMSQRGYAGTSVSEIVASVGVGPPTLYWYFKSKRGILAAVMQRGADSWMAQLPRPEDIVGSTPRERFLRAGKIASAALGSEPQFLRLLIMLSLERGSDDDAVRDTVLDIRRRARAWLVAMLQSCWPALPLEDARKLAAFEMAIADGLQVMRAIEQRDGVATQEFAATIVADTAEELALARRLRRRGTA